MKDSAVIARDTEDGEAQLVAFIVPATPETGVDGNTLRARLQQILPEYMVPAVFVNLPELPITPTGKIDRRTLKSTPAISAAHVGELERFVAPDDLERKLVSIFERLLEVRPVSVTGNFFSLGGHSLLAVRLFSEIAKLCGSKLPPSTVFRAPTVESLANLLTQEGAAQTWASLVPIKASGTLPPLFCVHPRGSNLVRYHALANLLGPDQPFVRVAVYSARRETGGQHSN